MRMEQYWRVSGHYDVIGEKFQKIVNVQIIPVLPRRVSVKMVDHNAIACKIFPFASKLAKRKRNCFSL